MFGRLYHLNVQCIPKTQYAFNNYFVSSLGTVHEIYHQAYWVAPTPSPSTGFGQEYDFGYKRSAPQTCSDPKSVSKPVHTTIGSSQYRDRLTLKFHEGTGIRLRNGKFVSLAGVDVSDLEKTLNQYPVRMERLVNRLEEDLDKEKARIEAQSGTKTCLADFNLYYRLRINPNSNVEQLIDQLNALPIVELVEPDPKALAPPPGNN